jgi:hypothetical protein
MAEAALAIEASFAADAGVGSIAQTRAPRKYFLYCRNVRNLADWLFVSRQTS